MRKSILFVSATIFMQFVFASTHTLADSLSERMRASETLRGLKNGCIVFRLKTNDKSVKAYRDAGRNDVADRIVAERKKQNQKIVQAFRQNFTFCKVNFIYAAETQSFLSGSSTLFLNNDLLPDSSIQSCGSNFIFCEYGSVNAYSKFGNTSPTGLYYSKPEKFMDTIATSSTTSPTTTDALFLSDKNLVPLQRPFPYVEDVYLDNYNAAAKALNRELYNAYQKLVIGEDYKNTKRQQKKERKKK